MNMAFSSTTSKTPSYRSVPSYYYCLIVLSSCICYWNSLSTGLVFDDVSAIRDNKDLRPSTPFINLLQNDFWGTPINKEHSHKSYRPFTVLTFRINYYFHELQPYGYHLVNLILHIIVSLLYIKLCRLFVSQKTSLIATIIFAIHPVHTEAVTGIVGRAELLSSIFFLLALLIFRETTKVKLECLKNLLLFSIYVTLAVFSKEQGITILGICFVYDLFISQNLSLPELIFKPSSLNIYRTSLLILLGGTLLSLRIYVMGSTLPVFTNFDNPASYESTPIKQLTWSYLIAINSWLLLCPIHLCCDWTMSTVPLIKSISDLRNLSTIAVLLALLNLGLVGLFNSSSKHRNVILISLSFIIFPYLPASNLFFPVGFVVAERILYIPSMGFALLVAYGFQILYQSLSIKKVLNCLLYTILIIYGLRTINRNQDWKTEYSIFMSGLKVTQSNAKLWNNVGHALESVEKFNEALKYFLKASQVQPDDIGAYINVGRTYNNLGMDENAEVAYLKAKSLLPKAKKGNKYTTRIAPHHLNVFLNLANLISKDPNRLSEAESLYRQAISMRSDYVQAYINLGDILIKMNRTYEAHEIYLEALVYNNDNPDIYYNLGVVSIEINLPGKALEYFDKALSYDPNHVQSLMNSAILIQETGSEEHRYLAYERLFLVEKLLAPEKSDRVYFNLAMLAMDDDDYTRAEEWFKSAIHLKPDFRSALFNLSLLLNEKRRSLEAIPHLRTLLRYHPHHVKGMILLGDIYTNVIKDFSEAERIYKKIIDIDPTHVQGQHNLCVVYVEKGLLEQAEQCLTKVLQLAPKETYIYKHLQILQKRRKQKQSSLENNA